MAVVKNMIVRVGADLSGLVSGFKKGSGATGSFAKQTEQALKNSTLSLGNLKKAMAQGGKNAAIVSLTDQIRELEAEQKALKEAGLSWGYEGFEGNEALLRDLKSQLNDYIKSLDDTGESTEEVAQKTSRLGTAARSALGWLKDTAAKALSFGKQSKSSSASIEGLVRSIRRIGLVSIGLRLVKSIFGELQSVVTQYVSQNAALQAQVTALKSSLGQALAPAINLVTNALSALMPYVVGISNAIGSLISNLFGSGWTTVADGANAAAAAIGGAGGAQKEFNRQLAGFDEITKLSADSGGGGGGSSTATTAVEGKTPAWFTSLSQQIQQAAAQGDFFGVGAALANAVNTGINSINLLDTSLGSKIAGLINGGIAGATGFVQTMDWSGLGTAIKNNVTGLISGIDWAGAFRLAGSAAGGIASALGSMFSGAFTGLADYIEECTEQCGGDILAGVLLGIVKGVGKIGSWLKDNLLTPFIDGFKNTFDIHSPSKHKDILSIGKNIMLGIFDGLTEPLRDPIGWIKKNIFAPLSQGFASVFGEDSLLAKSVSKLFFGDESFGRNLEVDVTANVTKIEDHAPEKIINNGKLLVNILGDRVSNKTFGNGNLQVTTLTDRAGNKSFGNGNLQVTTLTDRAGNKSFGNGNLQVTSLTDRAGNKSFGNGNLQVTTLTDRAGNKSFGNGNLQVTTLTDRAGNKSFGNGNLQVTSLTDRAGNKSFGNGNLQVTSLTDRAGNKSFGNGNLQVTTLTDRAGSKTFGNGSLQVVALTDHVSNKTLNNGRLAVDSWTDNIGDKTVSVAAKVKKGWSGSLENALGISTLTTTLNVKTPKIKVTWSTSKADPLNPNSASTKVPTYTAWFAKGAILRGAQLFGRIGNTLLGGGEAGREAVLPLDRNTWWMDKIANRVALKLTGGGQAGDQNITVNLVVDGKILASTVVRHVNAQARATGKNPLAAYM